MSVNPVSASQGWSFGSEDLLAKTLKEKLRKLGHSSTGNVAGDKLLLEKVIMTLAKSEVDGAGQKPVLPWQDTLNELALTTTGDKDKDYNLIKTTLEQKIAGANENDKKYYKAMQEETDSLFGSHNRTTSTPMGAMVGADLLAQINRKFML